MEERIIKALAIALNGIFPNIPVIDTEAEQDVKRPVFFVQIVEAELTERIKPGGFFMRYNFDLIYDPGVVRADIECRNVERELTLLLRRIPDTESVYAFRPTDIHFEIVEGILHALFNVVVEVKPENQHLDTIDKFRPYSRIRN